MEGIIDISSFLSTLTSFILAFGGWEGWKAWRHRKSDDRKANASAAKEEVEVEAMKYKGLEDYNLFLQQKLGERDLKIDALYVELREEQNTVLMMTAEANINDLSLKEAEKWKCKIMACRKRVPKWDDVVYEDGEGNPVTADEKGNPVIDKNHIDSIHQRNTKKGEL